MSHSGSLGFPSQDDASEEDSHALARLRATVSQWEQEFLPQLAEHGVRRILIERDDTPGPADDTRQLFVTLVRADGIRCSFPVPDSFEVQDFPFPSDIVGLPPTLASEMARLGTPGPPTARRLVTVEHLVRRAWEATENRPEVRASVVAEIWRQRIDRTICAHAAVLRTAPLAGVRVSVIDDATFRGFILEVLGEGSTVLGLLIYRWRWREGSTPMFSLGLGSAQSPAEQTLAADTSAAILNQLAGGVEVHLPILAAACVVLARRRHRTD